MLTEEFLNSKIKTYIHPSYGECVYRSGYGNIEKITDNVWSFEEYNFLPGQDGQLDGHYTFYVNIQNFQYCLYSHAFYGGLCYTTNSQNENWVKNLNEREKNQVESIIAYKLLYAYYYEDGMKTPLYGGKVSLICDYRNYIWCGLKPTEMSKHDIEAIKTLDVTHVFKTMKTCTLGKIQKGDGVYILPIEISFTDETNTTIYIKRILNKYTKYFILSNGEREISNLVSYSGKPSDILKMLPSFINNANFIC